VVRADAVVTVFSGYGEARFVEEPVADADPKKDEEAEPVEAAIWTAMDGLVRFSQASIIDRISVFVQLEAIRTKKHQTQF
jgi:hypothetical protein